MFRASEDFRKFFDTIRKDCQKSEVEIELCHSYRVFLNGVATSGFFDASSGKIVIAVKGQDENSVRDLLAHEYCHFLQWKEFPDIFSRPFYLGLSYDETIDSWLSGENFPLKIIENAYSLAVEIEIDCEIRALSLLRRHFDGFDGKKYAKNANAYINFYPYSLELRQWYEKPPWSIDNILKKMPDEICLKPKSDELRKAFLPCF